MLSAAAITKAFRQQSLLVHPDKNPAAEAEEAFKRLQAAYAALKEEQASGAAVSTAWADHRAPARGGAGGYYSDYGRPSYGDGHDANCNSSPRGAAGAARARGANWHYA